MFRSPLVFIGIFFFSLCIFAKEVVVVDREIQIENLNRSLARKEARDQVTKEVSYEYIKKIIGLKKFEKSKKQIESILKAHQKYIFSLKIYNIQTEEKGYKMSVALNLSITNLKNLLLKNGLLYKVEGQPRVLALISIADSQGSLSFSWWAQEQVDFYLKNQTQNFYKSLYKQFGTRGFYVLPVIKNRFSYMIPPSFREQKLDNLDFLFLSAFFDSQIILNGTVNLKKKKQNNYEVSYHLKAEQSSNRRIIGEVKRQYKVNSSDIKEALHRGFSEFGTSVSKDLARQVLESWEQGTFGSHLLKISIDRSLKYKELKTVKSAIKNLRFVKNIQEHFLTPKNVVFEVDTSLHSKAFSQAIEKQTFSQFKLKLRKWDSKKVSFSIEFNN